MIEDHERAQALRDLASRLGIVIEDLALFDRALTHASTAASPEGPFYNYESLEFVGDAALSFAVANLLFESVPDRTPGEYSRMRAKLVNKRSLARIARRLDIAPAIQLGKSEELSGGRNRSALQADCLEALIGALYLDQGWEAVRAFVACVFRDEFEHACDLDTVWDYKSRLQHYCQAERIALPRFVLVRSEGPDHKKEFKVEVVLDGEPAGRGVGASKKEAEQHAARAALERIGLRFE